MRTCQARAFWGLTLHRQSRRGDEARVVKTVGERRQRCHPENVSRLLRRALEKIPDPQRRMLDKFRIIGFCCGAIFRGCSSIAIAVWPNPGNS